MTTEDRRVSGPIEKKGGYESGPKQVSDLKPPPKGPAPGAKPANGKK